MRVRTKEFNFCVNSDSLSTTPGKIGMRLSLQYRFHWRKPTNIMTEADDVVKDLGMNVFGTANWDKL